MKNNETKNKKTVFVGNKFLLDILNGIKKISNVVEQTIGPNGNNIIFQGNLEEVIVTKDGITVVKNFSIKDKIEKIGFQLLKEGVDKTNEDSGDGTSATTILIYSILQKSLKMISSNWDRHIIVNSLNKILKICVKEIKNIAIQITKDKDIKNIATISSNSNEIGEIISQAFNKVGKNGTITISNSNTNLTSLTTTEGVTIKSGYVSNKLITNEKKEICELLNPDVILISDPKSNLTIKDFFALLKYIIENRRDFIIIYDNLREEIIESFIMNKISVLGALKNIRFCLVPSEGFGDSKLITLKDISILTGATILGPNTGINLHKFNNNMFGGAAKIIVKKNETIIIEGKGNINKISSAKQNILNAISMAKNNYEKEELNTRLSRYGNIAVIRVGDYNVTKANEKKFRVEDAVNATRSAIEEGIIPGGGIIYIILIKILESKYDYKDLGIGYQIIKEAFLYPIKCILNNSNVNSEIIIYKILEQLDIKNKKYIGYDAKKLKFTNMIESGIIDPAKVIISVLTNSISVANLILESKGLLLKEK